MNLEMGAEEIKQTRIKMLKVHDLLHDQYGDQCHNGKTSPLDELLLNILSLNTTEAHSHLAFDQLKKRFKGWERVMIAPTEEIAGIIQKGGLHRTKALRMKRILRKIFKDQGCLSLDFLKKANAKEAMKYLLSLKGIGSQTASCVLLYALDHPIMPVNMHVERVAKRLGWVWSGAKFDTIQEVFETVAPRYLIRSLYNKLMKHSRVACKEKNPRCSTCIVRGCCDYYQRKVKA